MLSVYIILLVLHLMLSYIYAADYRQSGNINDRQGAFLRFVVVAAIPVVGFVLMWCADFFFGRNDEKKVSTITELFDNTTELELLKPVNVDDEVNRIPMVDALILGDYGYRRKMIVNTLKDDDTIEYLDVLRDALVNEDSETSHYASAIIMDVQGKLQDSLIKKEELFLKNRNDRSAALDYEEELYKLITSGIYDERNLNKYYVRYKMVSDSILKLSDIPEHCIDHRIDIDLKTDDTAHASDMCNVYRAVYPESETMVIDNIKVCIKMNDRQRLYSFLDELKNYPVLLTSQSLQYIRLFEGRNNQ